MAITATERTLRIITITNFLPALVLGIVSGIETDSVKEWWMIRTPPVAYFSGVPAFFSALTSAAVLYANRPKSVRLGDDAMVKMKRAITLVIDVLLAGGHLALLIPLFIMDVRVMPFQQEASMVLAYATMPLLTNLFIHTYLAIADLMPIVSNTFMVLLRKALASADESTKCPHCQQSRRTWASGKDGYSLLRTDDHDGGDAESSNPRASAEV